MAYTVTKLITKAYYLSGIVSRDFETVSGSQLDDGLDTLNMCLASVTANEGMIPYYTQYNFNAVAGQETYFIENLVNVDTLTFFIDGVRYSTISNGRRAYFGTPRATNIDSLPYNFHFERQHGGGNIYLYFTPDEAYPLEIWGQFRLGQYAINDDLSLTLDNFYIDFLMYKLAERLCDNYSYIVPNGVRNRLKEIETAINNKTGPMDLSCSIVSTLNSSSDSLNYGQVNIGHGWTIG